MAIKAFKADLHIHTLLSPCGELEMLPTLIMEAAKMAGLDMIAVADHNSCENAGAVIEASQGSGVKVLPGLEVYTEEGVHLLCIFDELSDALEMQKTIYDSLPDVGIQEKMRAEQIIVDARDEFLGYCGMPLSVPASLSIDEVFKRASELGGIVIPSHIDRTATGICDVLGWIPDEPSFEAVEISGNVSVSEIRKRHTEIGDRPVLQSSDAHWLSAVGSRYSTFFLEHRSVDEIKRALRSEDGRRVENA